MNNQTKILKCLLESEGERRTILSIAKQLQINYRTIFEDVKALEKEGIISIQKVGSVNLCSYTYIFNEKTVKVERWRKEMLLKDKNVNVLYERLKELQNPFFIAIVFGSYAKKTVGRTSDIDLCIITENKEVQKKVEGIVRTTALNIHLLIFSLQEFMSMLKTVEENVGKEIVKRNIILKGVEPFYELIHNA